MKKLSKATSLVLTVSLLAGLLLPVSALAADQCGICGLGQ